MPDITDPVADPGDDFPQPSGYFTHGFGFAIWFTIEMILEQLK